MLCYKRLEHAKGAGVSVCRMRLIMREMRVVALVTLPIESAVHLWFDTVVK